MNETGIFIANFGGGTTELSVLSRGGMVMNRLLKTGGETLDAAIAGRVRRNREFLIGKSTAERLRKEFAVFEDGTEDAKRVYGRDLTSGVPHILRYRSVLCVRRSRSLWKNVQRQSDPCSREPRRMSEGRSRPGESI